MLMGAFSTYVVAVISGLLLMRDSDLYVGKRAARRPGAVREGLAYVRTRPDLLMLITERYVERKSIRLASITA